MKKLICLCLSLLLCMSMVTPVAAMDETDPWSCFKFNVANKDARVYKDSVPLVIEDEFYGGVSESNSDTVYAFREGFEFTVTNLDCQYGVYIYFETFTLQEEGSIAIDDVDENGDYCVSQLDVSGKYLTGNTTTYLSTSDQYGDAVPATNGLYWSSSWYSRPTYDGNVDNLFLLQPGESISFTLPDNSPDTLYRLYAEYYSEEDDDYYWRMLTVVVDDGLFAQSSPIGGEKENNPFTDVPADAYYHDAVLWAYENKITTGTSETTFGPNDTCTRGQVVTFLWRAKGCPEPNSTNNPFTDVNETDYFYKAVLWAVEQGITNGVTATTFGSNDTCSSAHIVTFLWRANGKPAATGDSALAAANPGQWYTEAVAWADTAGLLSSSDVTFAPTNNSPRADVVTYLYLDLAN